MKTAKMIIRGVVWAIVIFAWITFVFVISKKKDLIKL